jgi:hypothetical protein
MDIISDHKLALEYYKCKVSPLYFIENYCSFPVVGGSIPVKESKTWYKTPRYRELVISLQEYDSAILLASRQLGKTTIVSFYVLWSLIFYPGIKAVLITLDMTRAKDFIKRIKDVMEGLPSWMRIKYKSKSDVLTYLELVNGSKLQTFYPSGSNDPDKLGRGLTVPILVMDEAAFLKDLGVIWRSASPALNAAKAQAKLSGYPTLRVLMTTPNGQDNDFYTEFLSKSTMYEDIFDYETGMYYEDANQVLTSNDKNNFVTHKIHWSEVFDEEWYKVQCKELNWNTRNINQELNLVFLGSSTTIFSDEIIQELIIKKPIDKIPLPYGTYLDIYRNIEELDPNNTYILGVDTAASTGSTSDYSSMSLICAETSEEIASMKGRFSVIKRWGEILKSAVHGLISYGFTSQNLRVSPERNSYGLAVIEDLLYDENFPQECIFYTRKGEEYIPGINTSNANRDQYFILLMKEVNTSPQNFHSKNLIEELRTLEQKSNGRIEASRNSHDDNVMAYCFALFGAELMRKNDQINTSGEGHIVRETQILNMHGAVLDSMTTLRGVQSSDNMYSGVEMYDDDIDFARKRKKEQDNLEDFIYIL